MIIAPHAGILVSKLSCFHKGARILEAAITADDGNLELRFLRFVMQTQSPAMLDVGGEVVKDFWVNPENLSNEETNIYYHILREITWKNC